MTQSRTRSTPALSTQSRDSERSGPRNFGSNSDRIGGDQDGGVLPPRRLATLPSAQFEGEGSLGVHHADEVQAASQAPGSLDHDRYAHLEADPRLGITFDPEVSQDPDAALHMGKQGEAQRKNEGSHLDALGVHDLGDYREMLCRDFDFDGVVEQFGGSGSPEQRFEAGKKDFVEAALARLYPEEGRESVPTADIEAARQILLNLWSYAARGMDLDGRTDIAQMQGYLAVLDGSIRESSDKNTKMSEDPDAWFTVPGTEGWEEPIQLRKGDGRHGYATTLTTRHLFGTLAPTLEKKELETTPDPKLFDAEETWLLADKSGSMRNDEFSKLADVMKAAPGDGKVALGGFDDEAASLSLVQGGAPLDRDEAADILRDSGKHGKVDRRTIPKADPALYKSSGHGNQEEGLANALAWLLQAEAKMKNGTIPPDTERCLLILTDETDANPSVLVKVQELAKKLDFQVKVMISFASGTATGDWSKELNHSDSFQIVDVLAIKPEDLATLTSYGSNKKKGELDWRKAADAQHAPVHTWDELKTK